MVKGKKQSKRPQAKHKPKGRSAQHDKRKRLDTLNPQRKKTVQAKVPLTGKMAGIDADDSAHDPEPEEIPHADQGRDQLVYSTTTIRSTDSCLFRQKRMGLAVVNLRVLSPSWLKN